MRWRLLGLLLFAAAGAVAWTFWWRPQAEDWMKVRLESDLSRFLGQDVRVDAVRLHPLLLQAQIVHLRVGPAAGPLFVCDRWTFHTVFTADPSPFALLSFTLGRSDVDRPTFRVPPLPHPSRPLPEGWWRRFPLHRLNWRNGTFRFPGGADRAPLDLFETEGTLSLSPRGFFLDIEGDSVAGRFDVSLEGAEALRRGLHLSVHGKASVSNASLDFISPWLPAGSGRNKIQRAVGFWGERISRPKGPWTIFPFHLWRGRVLVQRFVGVSSRGFGTPSGCHQTRALKIRASL